MLEGKSLTKKIIVSMMRIQGHIAKPRVKVAQDATCPHFETILGENPYFYPNFPTVFVSVQ